MECSSVQSSVDTSVYSNLKEEELVINDFCKIIRQVCGSEESCNIKAFWRVPVGTLNFCSHFEITPNSEHSSNILPKILFVQFASCTWSNKNNVGIPREYFAYLMLMSGLRVYFLLERPRRTIFHPAIWHPTSPWSPSLKKKKSSLRCVIGFCIWYIGSCIGVRLWTSTSKYATHKLLWMLFCLPSAKIAWRYQCRKGKMLVAWYKNGRLGQMRPFALTW